MLSDTARNDPTYLYQATVQVSGQVVRFLAGHVGFPIPSPAILERIGVGFGKAVTEFAAEGGIPVVGFVKGQRTLEVMRPHLDRLVRANRSGVAAIGVAQEFQRVFTGTTYHGDEDFGSAFITVCAYLPYPVKIRLNGHDYAKRATRAAGIAFTGLVTGSPPPRTPPPVNQPKP